MEAVTNRAKCLAAGFVVIALMMLAFASPANAYGADGENLVASGLQTQDG